MHKLMKKDPVGQQILSERPRITTKTVDPLVLKTYPMNTLGYQYYQFMTERGFVSDDRFVEFSGIFAHLS